MMHAQGNGLFSFARRYALRHGWRLGFILVLKALTVVTTMVYPFILSRYVDALIATPTPATVQRFVLCLGGLFLLTALVFFLFQAVRDRVASFISFDIMADTMAHIRRLPFHFFQGMERSALAPRVQADCTEICGFILLVFTDSVLSVVSVVVYFVILAKLSLGGTLALGVVIPIYVGLYFMQKGKIGRSNLHLKQSSQRVSAFYFRQVESIEFLKSHGLERTVEEQQASRFRDYMRNLIRFSRTSAAYESSLQLVKNFILVVAWGYCGYAVAKGETSIGQMQMAVNYSTQLLSSILFFATMGRNVQTARVSYARIAELLATHPESQGIVVPDSIQKVVFDRVSFSFSPDCRPIENFSRVLERGKLYCVVGRSGAGKSTLIRLLLGLYRPEKGEIFFDHHRQGELDLSELRLRHIGFVEQEPQFPFGSMTELMPQSSSTALDELLSRLGLDHLRATLQADTEAVEVVRSLSGGEKQRLALVRELAAEKPIVVLDEPTSALDSQNTQKVKDFLNEVKRRCILIVVTHSPEILPVADEVIDLEALSATSIQ